ncbi:hypothetical protein CDAR_393981 [Caerostris darwini]|uniref:Uncharacterized protein n=1 Tax=Caerostris darwini TaxID=1538125 RepID=A0AAV4TPN6_9ARAC|nr:hypothetical protein CDAR_393981 [Caerostris darwini]
MPASLQVAHCSSTIISILAAKKTKAEPKPVGILQAFNLEKTENQTMPPLSEEYGSNPQGILPLLSELGESVRLGKRAAPFSRNLLLLLLTNYSIA